MDRVLRQVEVVGKKSLDLVEIAHCERNICELKLAHSPPRDGFDGPILTQLYRLAFGLHNRAPSNESKIDLIGLFTKLRACAWFTFQIAPFFGIRRNGERKLDDAGQP